MRLSMSVRTMRTSPLAENTLRVTSDESHATFIKDVVVVAEVAHVKKAFDTEFFDGDKDAELSDACDVPNVVSADVFTRKNGLRAFVGCTFCFY